MFGTLAKFALIIALSAPIAAAANLVIYDEQSENGFNDGCSFGGIPSDFDFANATTVHSAPNSIRFTPDDFNAVSWCAPATYSATTDYGGIDFWVNGGTTGGQNVDLVLGLGANAAVVFASLTSLNGNNPIPAGAWVNIHASFAADLAYNGQFDRISFQDESGIVQADIYFDDVSLVPASSAVQNYIFGDSFEPEYMFVPQYNLGGTGSIKMYQRTTNTPNFTFVNEATLPAGAHPNAVVFAPDGTLWVVDDGHTQLLGYTLNSIVTSANPAPIVSYAVTNAPAQPAVGGLYDMAFFGDFGYVASDGGILKFAITDLNAGNGNAPTQFSGSFNIPAGLAFDAQGRLWICNNGNSSAVRMDNVNTGHIDKTLTDTAVGARHAMVSSEGVAFDEYGTLWVGNNNEPTISAYDDAQLNDGVPSTSPVPVYQVDIAPALGSGDIGGVHPTGFVGGIAFDHHGDVRANYEYDYSVQGYTFTSSGGVSYTASPLSALGNATTDPGRGGVAFWPRPPAVHIK
jgi:hypothetical protein